jgi:hypothetical protein
MNARRLFAISLRSAGRRSLIARAPQAQPDSVVRAIRDGIRPPIGALGRSMPSFGELSETEMDALVRFLRARFSGRPPWTK